MGLFSLQHYFLQEVFRETAWLSHHSFEITDYGIREIQRLSFPQYIFGQTILYHKDRQIPTIFEEGVTFDILKFH